MVGSHVPQGIKMPNPAANLTLAMAIYNYCDKEN